MVESFMNEGGDEGWNAMASPAVEPGMQMESQMNMQAQTEATEDVFGDAAFTSSSPIVTIITASGAAQNLEDDLTEEEKEIVRVADEN